LHLQKPLKAQGCSNTNLFGHNYPMRTIEELEKYYESASNTRIKEIASDKESLSPEALQILELEIEKRGFIQEDIQTKIIENQVREKKHDVFFLRIGARLIDGAILFVGLAIFSQVFLQGYDIIEAAKNLSVLSFYFFYYPILESNGGTFGKRILGIETVDSKSNSTISLSASYLRSLAQCWAVLITIIVFLVPFFYVVFIGTLIIFFLSIPLLPLTSYFDKNNQSIYDKWTNTFVIKKIVSEE
jgi:uncharacterized RDD family membrane protein YckC